ncbi:hypothetical protein KAW08_02645 [bacterium]|nr:hypothetical protein [bacterium]
MTVLTIFDKEKEVRKITDYARKVLNAFLSNNSIFTGLLVLSFLCIGLLNILTHEMWRDELQAWLIAKDSVSILNLFDNLKYEGHPALWHICLYFISRFTAQPIVMQFFHLLLAATTIYIFTRFSPFTKLQKTLFIFGYFPLYEYAAISRNYAMGVLFIFCFCAVFRTRTKNYIVLSCILFLLAQTSVYGLMISICFGCTLIMEYVFDRNLRKSLRARRTELIISIAIFILGIIGSVFQLMQPIDSGGRIWGISIDPRRISHVIAIPWKAYIPIPEFMNTEFIASTILPSRIPAAALSIILLCFSFLLFARKHVVAFLYTSATIGLLIFSYFIHFGELRHHGHLFILFIACLWISDYYTDIKLKSWLFNNLAGFCKKHKNRFIVGILSIHLIFGLAASGVDWFYPFSAGKETAKFIKDKQMDNMLMLGDMDFPASVVAGYLNRKIYYTQSNKFGSFIIWNNKRGDHSTHKILKKAQELTQQRKEDILLIMNYELDISSALNPIVKIKEFKKSIVPNEKYYLYLMSYDDMGK